MLHAEMLHITLTTYLFSTPLLLALLWQKYFGAIFFNHLTITHVMNRNSCTEVSYEAFLKNFAKTTGKHKFTGLHCSCFPMNFQKHFQISYFIEHLWKAASTVLILLNFNYAWIWKCFDDFYTVFYHNLKMKFI